MDNLTGAASCGRKLQNTSVEAPKASIVYYMRNDQIS